LDLNPGLFATAEGDRPVPVDTTYYVGTSASAVSWRAYAKEHDRRDPVTLTAEQLPDKNRRARIEVTLNQLELRRLGLRSLDDLGRFNFAKLQGEYFRFMLPTFESNHGGRAAAARRWLTVNRQTKFLNTGVVGLTAMDAAEKRLAEPRRKSLVLRSRKGELQVKPLRRDGRGKTTTLAAYDELNARVQAALRRLTGREGWMEVV